MIERDRYGYRYTDMYTPLSLSPSLINSSHPLPYLLSPYSSRHQLPLSPLCFLSTLSLPPPPPLILGVLISCQDRTRPFLCLICVLSFFSFIHFIDSLFYILWDCIAFGCGVCGVISYCQLFIFIFDGDSDFLD